MRITAEPRSDQWNADDFIGGPRTFTIAGVEVGSAEQKYDIALVEGQGRAWRPPLTMLRLLIAAWGDETAPWIGRRVTLYRDESIRFGADAVGGIRVSHMSDLPTGTKPFEVKLTSSRGHRSMVRVEPLTDVPTSTEPTADQVAACTDDAALHALYDAAKSPEMRALIRARKAELIARPAPTLDNPLDYSGDDLGDGAM